MKSILVNAPARLALAITLVATAADVYAAPDKPPSSYMPVVIDEPFAEIMQRMAADKPKHEKTHNSLLEQRYDLSDKPASGVTMSRGKPVQGGVRVKLADGSSWQQLNELSAEEIRQKKLFPAGFLPLPHPNHAEERQWGQSD